MPTYADVCSLCVTGMMPLQDVPAVVQGVADVAARHDLSREVAGNGYWSQLRVLSCCLKKMKQKLRAVGDERESVFFGTRVKSLLHALSSYHRILVILKALLHTTLVFRRNDLVHESTHREELAAAAAAATPSAHAGLIDVLTYADVC